MTDVCLKFEGTKHGSSVYLPGTVERDLAGLQHLKPEAVKIAECTLLLISQGGCAGLV